MQFNGQHSPKNQSEKKKILYYMLDIFLSTICPFPTHLIYLVQSNKKTKLVFCYFCPNKTWYISPLRCLWFRHRHSTHRNTEDHLRLSRLILSLYLNSLKPISNLSHYNTNMMWDEWGDASFSDSDEQRHQQQPPDQDSHLNFDFFSELSKPKVCASFPNKLGFLFLFSFVHYVLIVNFQLGR